MPTTTKSFKTVEVIEDELKPQAQEIISELTPTQQIDKALLDDFGAIRLIDVRGRIKLRWIVASFLMFLLFLQNVAVFGLVVYTLTTDRLADLQTIFAVLVSATLVESAYMVKKIVEFLFEDIQYPS